MPVITSGPGYNGVTGAKATYSQAEDMWIDTNGERIRTDAIVPGEAPAKAVAAPPAPDSRPVDSGGGGAAGGAGGGAGGAAMGGLRSAMMSSTPQEPTMTNMGTPAAGNPNLGNRNLPINALKLALRQSQAGRVY